jgi:hypothetical protein
MTEFAFEVLTEEELEEETKDPFTTTYESVDRAGMVYCDFCKGYYFPEYHYGDVSND